MIFKHHSLTLEPHASTLQSNCRCHSIGLAGHLKTPSGYQPGHILHAAFWHHSLPCLSSAVHNLYAPWQARFAIRSCLRSHSSRRFAMLRAHERSGSLSFRQHSRPPSALDAADVEHCEQQCHGQGLQASISTRGVRLCQQQPT